MNYISYIKSCSILLISVVAVAECKIPSYIKVCQRSDPDISACIRHSFETLRPLLIDGIEELNIPGLKELKLDSLRITPFRGRQNHITTNITNIRVYGLPDLKVVKFEANVNKPINTFTFDVIVPQIYIKAEYEMDTKLLLINLKGNGPLYVNVSNYNLHCTMEGEKVVKNSVNHMKFKNVKIKMVFGKGTILFENLYSGNEVLAKAANDVINDNSDAFFAEITPAVSRALERVTIRLANNIASAFSYEELFP